MPKIQMQVEAEPRHLVRNVEMERRRRFYKSFDLSKLFQDEGIDFNDDFIDAMSSTDRLNLETFDDEEYDCRYVY